MPFDSAQRLKDSPVALLPSTSSCSASASSLQPCMDTCSLHLALLFWHDCGVYSQPVALRPVTTAPAGSLYEAWSNLRSDAALILSVGGFKAP